MLTSRLYEFHLRSLLIIHATRLGLHYLTSLSLFLQILAKSCGTLLQKFSADENAIINGEQFHTPMNGKNSASLYMSDQGIEHTSFIPLPPKVSDKYGNAECASFMGLIPEIRRQTTTQLHYNALQIIENFMHQYRLDLHCNVQQNCYRCNRLLLIA